MHDLRRWTHDVHRSVDDSPYGGGPGMVMKAPVWGEALDEICSDETLLVVPTPAGRLFTQADAQRWSTEKHLVFACGRYEGIDQRVADDAARRMRVEEVSIGDYVLPGGESAALVMIEAVVRLLPDVLGNPASHQDDSHSDGLLEGPSYTRPPSWRGLDVPDVLLSGDHAKIAAWRREQGAAAHPRAPPRPAGLNRRTGSTCRWSMMPSSTTSSAPRCCTSSGTSAMRRTTSPFRRLCPSDAIAVATATAPQSRCVMPMMRVSQCRSTEMARFCQNVSCQFAKTAPPRRPGRRRRRLAVVFCQPRRSCSYGDGGEPRIDALHQHRLVARVSPSSRRRHSRDAQAQPAKHRAARGVRSA